MSLDFLDNVLNMALHFHNKYLKQSLIIWYHEMSIGLIQVMHIVFKVTKVLIETKRKYWKFVCSSET